MKIEIELGFSHIRDSIAMINRALKSYPNDNEAVSLKHLRDSLVNGLPESMQKMLDTRPMIERVLEDIRQQADNATGGDFAVVEFDLIPNCQKRLGINAKQYGGYMTQLQKAKRINISKTEVNGTEKITQVYGIEGGK